MADNIKIPEETLMRIGFKTLDLMYGELTIKKGGSYWNEVFVDKYGDARLTYNKGELKKESILGYHYKDRDFFLSIIPVKLGDYQRVLKDWMLERYKREVGTTPIRGWDLELGVL